VHVVVHHQSLQDSPFIHCPFVVHGSPTSPSTQIDPVRSHVRFVQQSLGLLHEPPAARHEGAAGAHVPPEQVDSVGLQQSETYVHVPPDR
jgi:hypothetical protein